jgi:hypothetical protein
MKRTNRDFCPSTYLVFVVLMAVATLGLNSAQAANRIFDLHLKNGDRHDSVTFTIGPSDGSDGDICYEGYPRAGQQVGGNVAPGAFVTIRLARVQGHNCDGKGGGFYIIPSDGNKAVAHFEFSNDGGLWVVDLPNDYRGKLSAKSPQDESYTWETPGKPDVTASKPVGSWDRVCSQLCDMTFKQEIVDTKSSTEVTSQETKNALSASLEVGISFPLGEAVGGEVKATTTSSSEQTVGQSMSRELSSSSTTGKETRVAFTLEQMEERHVFAVWQWVAKSVLSTGEELELPKNI